MRRPATAGGSIIPLWGIEFSSMEIKMKVLPLLVVSVLPLVAAVAPIAYAELEAENGTDVILIRP
ncbi:hypothetical protein ASC96_30980 [Rhizobium sp. Root1204]|nr:hypothetical protein ASC96_30980 [Rhizobium sp. Root1204]